MKTPLFGFTELLFQSYVFRIDFAILFLTPVLNGFVMLALRAYVPNRCFRNCVPSCCFALVFGTLSVPFESPFGGKGQNAFFSPDLLACISLGGSRVGGDKQLLKNIKHSVHSLQYISKYSKI